MKIITDIKETKTRLLAAILFALCIAVPTLAEFAPGYLTPRPPSYQIDIGWHVIRQNGIKVGEIYAPFREPGAANYVEHWVLYDNFVYIGKDPSLATTIEQGQKGYESEEDFFARVPWGPGFKYVRVDCAEFDRLPGK